jgi:hypothetical protein
VTLADITNSQGTAILETAKSGALSIHKSVIIGEKFNQAKPNQVAWGSWRRFLTKFETPTGHLHTPLRAWIVTHDRCRRRQKFVYDPNTSSLYQHQEGPQYCKLVAHGQRAYHKESTLDLSDAVGYPVHVHEMQTLVCPMMNYHPVQDNTVILNQNFTAFTASLDKWERDMLSSVTLLDDPSLIMHELNEGPFNVGSDGSVIGEKAAFGYVVSSIHKRRLIRGKGCAPGSRPQSFRAEAYGAVAVRRMLLRLGQYTGVPLTSSYRHHIDNKAVIQRSVKADKYKYHIPNTTLSPDWDIISMMATSNHELPQNALCWIKGHQDKESPRESLSHPAQLNCEADDEAGVYQANNAPRTNVPMFPTTHAQLIIQGATVNSYYKSRIREAATLPTYFAYLESKYHWSSATRQEIDWSNYKQTVRLFRDSHTIMVKHVHEIAPSGHISHRNNHHYPQNCPSCDCVDETNAHVIICPAASRAAWRQKLLTQMERTTSSTKSDPFLADILRDGLQRWFNDLPPIPLASYPYRYRALIASQNSIGWSHLFRARWSSQWKLAHQDYAERISLTEENSDGARWVRTLGRQLIQAWLDLWKIRNTERHGKDEAEQNEKRKTHLVSQLEELYSYKPAVLPTHRHMFLADVATHLEQRPHLDGLEDWIHTFGPAIHSSMKQARTREILEAILPQQ